jgi:hypothetical protein
MEAEAHAETAVKAHPPRQPDAHDFNRLITAGRLLLEFDLHRKPMRGEVYRTTAVAVAQLLARVQDTPELRDIVAIGEPTLTLFENVAFERDGDFRAVAGATAGRDAAALAEAFLRRIAEPDALR